MIGLSMGSPIVSNDLLGTAITEASKMSFNAGGGRLSKRGVAQEQRKC